MGVLNHVAEVAKTSDDGLGIVGTFGKFRYKVPPPGTRIPGYR
jgi:hypothetical protein